MAMQTQAPPALVVVMCGQLSADGNLDQLTTLKLRKAAEVGRSLSRSGHAYFYVFPDSRKYGQYRMCDVMKKEIQNTDGGNYRGVQVPEDAELLETVYQRQEFVNKLKKVSASWNCQYIQ
jgi:hypothetical protein